MAIVVEEKYKGRRRDATSAEILYIVTGTGDDKGNVDDATAFDAVVDAAEPTWAGIPGANVDVREELIQDTVWLVAVIYGDSSGDSTIFPQSTVEYEFSFQAPSERVYQSLETIGVYSVNGECASDMFGGAINVKNYFNGEVDGLDMPPGSPTSTFIYRPLSAIVTDAYQLAVEAIMGDVNSVTFKGRAAKTMRLVSCDGGALFSSGTIPRWVIRYGFQFSRSRSNFTSGGITIPFKGGHHLMWGYYEDSLHEGEADTEDNGPIKRPKFLVVEKVFQESNLASVLGI